MDVVCRTHAGLNYSVALVFPNTPSTMPYFGPSIE